MVFKVKEITDIEERDEFYEKHRGVFYDYFDDVGRYGLLGTVQITQEMMDKINKVSRELVPILTKVKNYIQDEMSEDVMVNKYNYPEGTPEFMKLKFHEGDYTRSAITTRLDYIWDEKNDKPVLIEVNSDTPFLLMESFYMGSKVNDYLGVKDPNENAEYKLIKGLIDRINEAPYKVGNIAFITFPEDVDYEEYLSMQYLVNLINTNSQYNAHLVPIEEIEIVMVGEDRGLYHGDMRIDTLFRPAYPLEFLIEDEFGFDMLELVRDGLLNMISHPDSLILQNKMIFSIITDLTLKGDFFTPHEDRIISEYLPAMTFRTQHPFHDMGIDYVSKPSFGREGSDVEIHHIKDENYKSDTQGYYDDHDKIYQSYIKMPTVEITEWDEDEEGNIEEVTRERSILLGAHIINGEPSATSIRLGNKVTNWNSKWMSLSIENTVDK